MMISSNRNRNFCGVQNPTRNKMFLDFIAAIIVCSFCLLPICVSSSANLRFGKNGEFKILQVADMHYANGKTTRCLDVLHSQYASCSDLNTTAFIRRMILAEKPDLIVFTGSYLLIWFCFGCLLYFLCFSELLCWSFEFDSLI